MSYSRISAAKTKQGLDNFHHGQAFSGFSEFAQTFLFAFFSYGGVELVALAAGESKSPHKSVPSAVRATFFRIIAFYVLAVLVIGLCINRDDPTLLSAAYGWYSCRFSY
jgi:amino acid permease